MKKLFISQPMCGKTDEEILAARKLAIKQVQERIGEDVEVIDSFFQEHPTFDKPLKYLAESIALLADADIAYFAKNWDEARGCKVEHECAVAYGIYIMDEYIEPKAEEHKMKKYIGCKCVEAESCKAWKEMGTHEAGEDGYKVVYLDGYVTWSPKDVFEAAYIETPCNVSQETLHECTKQLVETITIAKALESLR